MPNSESRSDNSQSETNRNAFGKLVRFWRTTLDLSQAQLAEKVEAAPRHISFLETGRSNPTRDMVARISSAMQLGDREISTLYSAAGYSFDHQPLNIDSPENQTLKDTLSALLYQHEPYPALVVDHIGDMVMCNRSWLAMMDYIGLSEQMLRPTVNLYHLYFSEEGLKRGIINWEELACFLMLSIREQQMLTGNPRLEELSEWLQAYPGLPGDWAKRAKGIRSTSVYDVRYEAKAFQFHSRTLVTGVGLNRQDNFSQLGLHSLTPQNKDTKAHWDSLNLEHLTGHPLAPKLSAI